MDRYAIDKLGISGLELMHRAGCEAFGVLQQLIPSDCTVVVFCGAGNNAGDGYVLARLASHAGYPVKVYAIVSPEKLRGDAALVYQEFLQQVGEISEYQGSLPQDTGIVVDALLGTGLDRDVSGKFYEVIEKINCFNGPVLALDIPSGLNADTGSPMGIAVRAVNTVTFIGAKQGLYTGEGVDFSGSVKYASLEVPEEVFASIEPSSYLLSSPKEEFKPRQRSSHKGHFGHLLIVGGEIGFTGAARMAAQAGGRVGAGLISIASRKSHAATMNITQPELMCHGAETAEALQELLNAATVVGIGPGLGQADWAKTMFDAVLKSKVTAVVDADALNLLARSPVQRANWVLTPHPGEAARLLGCESAAICKDRFSAVTAIQKKYGGVCVLKGAGTLIADGETVAVCPTGNPGMASGGMGDVLTGVIAGLLAQGFCVGNAARDGVYLHGEAADRAAKSGERGLMATDLLPHLRNLVNS